MNIKCSGVYMIHYSGDLKHRFIHHENVILQNWLDIGLYQLFVSNFFVQSTGCRSSKLKIHFQYLCNFFKTCERDNRYLVLKIHE